MAIHYTCRCGANIRMPINVAGRKARCNSCGYIFTVPSPELNPDRPDADRQPLAGIPLEGAFEPQAAPSDGADESTGEIGDWLGEFAAHENTARSQTPTEFGKDAANPADAAESPRPDPKNADRTAASKPPATLLDLAEADDIIEPPAQTPRRKLMPSANEMADEDRSGILGPNQSYWADLAGSFFFFLDGSNLVTFVFIVLANLGVSSLASLLANGWGMPLGISRGAGIAVAGLAVIAGYLCTFYLAVIKETAAGEDELPNVWIDDIWGDLVSSLFRFLGTWAWVLIPASFFILFEYINLGRVHWNIAWLLGGIGLLFWPVVILGLALGGSFHGLWPHTIILTALVAPLPYLAMCGILLVATGITVFPYSTVYADAVSKVATKTSVSLFWTVALINSGISAYAMIVAMRVVGLYYRHFKHRFPWTAE